MSRRRATAERRPAISLWRRLAMSALRLRIHAVSVARWLARTKALLAAAAWPRAARHAERAPSRFSVLGAFAPPLPPPAARQSWSTTSDAAHISIVMSSSPHTARPALPTSSRISLAVPTSDASLGLLLLLMLKIPAPARSIDTSSITPPVSAMVLPCCSRVSRSSSTAARILAS